MPIDEHTERIHHLVRRGHPARSEPQTAEMERRSSSWFAEEFGPFFADCRRVARYAAYILLAILAVAVALGMVVGPFAFYKWLFDDFCEDIENPILPTLVCTIATWATLVIMIFYRKRVIPWTLSGIRAIRRLFRRIEEATRP